MLKKVNFGDPFVVTSGGDVLREDLFETFSTVFGQICLVFTSIGKILMDF